MWATCGQRIYRFIRLANFKSHKNNKESSGNILISPQCRARLLKIVYLQYL